MDFGLILSLFGGLALFLYGMRMMSDGLEAAAGNKMKKILEKLTANRFLGVLAGALITAVIQSSSATTVMVVGFVNSGLMTIRQAVWIIMGANIGTTITGQLIAIDVGVLAPLLAFLGVAMIVFLKKEKLHHFGSIIAGLGILFIGMDMMSASMHPLRESETFIKLITEFENPVLGILAGAIFTAIIQSSSASVGILQALASGGVIGLSNAVFVLFGQNIGTCITALIASVGTSRNAKCTTIIHLLFNIIGTTIFTTVCILTPMVKWVEAITPTNIPAQIANMHTIFNISTAIILIPFGAHLARLAVKILPEKKEEEMDVYHLEFINLHDTKDVKIGNSVIIINSVRKELSRMTQMVRENIEKSFDCAYNVSTENIEEVEKTEEYLDYLNKEISKYISNKIVHQTDPKDINLLSAYFKICGNLERIGDHAINISEYAKFLKEKNITFSETAQGEIKKMQEICLKAVNIICSESVISEEELSKVIAIEEEIDDMTESFRQNQIDRMHKGKCSDEACILYSEMLTDFERIGDHVLNIGEELSGVKRA